VEPNENKKQRKECSEIEKFDRLLYRKLDKRHVGVLAWRKVQLQLNLMILFSNDIGLH